MTDNLVLWHTWKHLIPCNGIRAPIYVGMGIKRLGKLWLWMLCVGKLFFAECRLKKGERAL